MFRVLLTLQTLDLLYSHYAALATGASSGTTISTGWIKRCSTAYIPTIELVLLWANEPLLAQG